MVSKKEVLALLPPFKNEKKLVTWRQSTNALVNEIVKTHEKYETDYDLIYQLFDTGDIYDTCAGLWNFCKYNLKYTIEGEDEQTVKSPTAILQSGEKIDCKHYSLFIAGVLDAIKQNMGDGWDWCYRFASYNGTKHIEHVFVVVFDPVTKKEIWIDPVLSGFNQHKQPSYYIDKYMALYSISGITDLLDSDAVTATVSKQNAFSNFLVLVNLNAMGYKTLLLNNPDITYGALRKYFIDNNFDFNQLLLILNSK